MALLVTLCSLAVCVAETVNVRIVTANLASGNDQSYSLDNRSHRNTEGAGARILKGLNADIVLISGIQYGDQHAAVGDANLRPEV